MAIALERGRLKRNLPWARLVSLTKGRIVAVATTGARGTHSIIWEGYAVEVATGQASK